MAGPATADQVRGRWLLTFNRQPNPWLRVFCFPYAGGDANIFRTWSRSLPEGVEVVGVQYPGRGAHDSPAIDDCDEMVTELRRNILPMLDRNFMFFGHSNGALISYELARTLDGAERSRQAHHFLSARTPAHLPLTRRRLSELDHAKFVAALKDFGGTPDEVLQDASLLNLLVPRLRADFRLGERYVHRPGAGIPCGATAIYGTRDVFVDGGNVHRWRELVKGDTHVHAFDAGHFLLHSHANEVLALVQQRIVALRPSLHDVVRSQPDVITTIASAQ